MRGREERYRRGRVGLRRVDVGRVGWVYERGRGEMARGDGADHIGNGGSH